MSRHGKKRFKPHSHRVGYNTRPQGQEARMRAIAKGFGLQVRAIESIDEGELEDCDQIVLYRNSADGRWQFELVVTYGRYGDGDPLVVGSSFLQTPRLGGEPVAEGASCRQKPGAAMAAFVAWTERQLLTAVSVAATA